MTKNAFLKRNIYFYILYNELGRSQFIELEIEDLSKMIVIGLLASSWDILKYCTFCPISIVLKGT